MREVLEERQFPVGEIRLAGVGAIRRTVSAVSGEAGSVGILKEDSFKDIDIGYSRPAASVSAKFAPLAVGAGAVVIDNTAFFRLEPDIPLVVPEVNAKEIAKYKNPRHRRQSELLDDPNGRRVQTNSRRGAHQARCGVDLSVGFRRRA